MTHPRKGSIVRCPLFENDSIKIGLFEANPISDLCWDVESQSLDAVVLPFVGVFAKHDAPGRHVIGTPSHAVFIDAHRPYRIAFPGAIGDRAIVIRFEDALVPCGIDCGRDGETLRSNALLPADTIIRRDRLRQRLSDPMRDSFELETMGIELLGQCLRARRNNPVPLRPAARLRRQRAVERVKEAVATAPAEAWSIAALAKIARLSPFHLCHAITTLSPAGNPRCHDLAKVVDPCGVCRSPQRYRRTAEKPPKPRGEMTMAGESGIEGDAGDVLVAVHNGIQRLRQPLTQHIVVERSADKPAKHVVGADKLRCARRLAAAPGPPIDRTCPCRHARDDLPAVDRSPRLGAGALCPRRARAAAMPIRAC